MASIFAVTYYASIEILIAISATFKRSHGLYIWSIFATAIGVMIYNTGNLLINFIPSSPVAFSYLCWHIGGATATTGFALVLWSRLHLVVRNLQLLKWLLVVIPFNGIVVNCMAVGVLFGDTLKHNKENTFATAVNYIGVVTFVVIEVALSSLYIYHTAHFLNAGHAVHARKVVGLLLTIQVFVILSDTALWVLTFTNRLQITILIHPLTQAIKLKLEVVILNQLQTLVSTGRHILDLDVECGLHLPSSSAKKHLQLSPRAEQHSRRSSAPAILTDNRTESRSDPADGTREQSLVGCHHIGAAHEAGRDEATSPNAPSEHDDIIDELEARYLGRWAFVDGQRAV